jgi:hypothetical protein
VHVKNNKNRIGQREPKPNYFCPPSEQTIESCTELYADRNQTQDLKTLPKACPFAIDALRWNGKYWNLSAQGHAIGVHTRNAQIKYSQISFCSLVETDEPHPHDVSLGQL